MPRLLDKPEDFIVDEIPAFQPCGHGGFTWIQIEKYNLHTDAVVHDLAALLRIPQRSIGYAGKKDKRSQSRQYLSIPGDVIKQVPTERQGDQSWWHIRQVHLHDHPLKLGQIQGNAFQLQLSACEPGFNAHVQNLCQQMLLNLYGPQRFGYQGNNVAAAKAWVHGAYDTCVQILIDPQQQQQGLLRPLQKQLAGGASPKLALARSGKRLRQFMASVLQSVVFNAVAKARHAQGLADTVQAGDLLLRQGKSPFHARADELAQLQVDVNKGLVSTTAPMPGFKVRQVGPEVLQQEQMWSSETGISWSCFDKGAIFASPGERRRIRVHFLQDPVFDEEHQILRFALPAGAYATTVLDALDVMHSR